MDTNISLEKYKELEKERDDWKNQYLEVVKAYNKLLKQSDDYNNEINEKISIIALDVNRINEEYKMMWDTLRDVINKAGDCLLKIDSKHTELKNDKNRK